MAPKVLTVVGARPQFIKAAPVSRALEARGMEEFLVHTGQHYDQGMSQVFFDELGLAAPRVNLGVGSGPQGWQTARMLTGLEEIILAQEPDLVLVYGDTNSTLAGSLAAAKLPMPLAHVEAGLRSYNRSMPEEHNRVVSDHLADLLFCPTQTAVDNLAREGVTQGVRLVGDTMYDAVLQMAALARQRTELLARLELRPGEFAVCTLHRPYNVDQPDKLRAILGALEEMPLPVVFPVHPRTRARIRDLTAWPGQGGALRLVEPVSYLDMLALMSYSRMVLTDSGGMQKEAYFLGRPCLTIRPETEWVETVAAGWNTLVGADPAAILDAARAARPVADQVGATAFGHGHAAEAIAEIIWQYTSPEGARA